MPLSHAHAVAEKLQAGAEQKEPAADSADDPRLAEHYACEINGDRHAGTLRDLLSEVAERVVDYLAAGEHLAIRFNAYSNFIYLGISVWKAITDADLLLARLEGRVRPQWHQKLCKLVLLGKGMLLKFLQAHSEDPAQIKPREFWYGQEYSYLTRDMIDLTRRLVGYVNRLAGRGPGEVDLVVLPPLLNSKAKGRFLEYQHVGRLPDPRPMASPSAPVAVGFALLPHRAQKNEPL